MRRNFLEKRNANIFFQKREPENFMAFRICFENRFVNSSNFEKTKRKGVLERRVDRKNIHGFLKKGCSTLKRIQ